MLYELLLPYAERVGVSYSEISIGPVSRFLGNLASVTGPLGRSGTPFRDERSEIGERLSARPSLVHTQYGYSRMLLARGEPGDRERARDLVTSAEASARSSGLTAGPHEASVIPTR